MAANAQEYDDNKDMGRIDVKSGSAYAHMNGNTFRIVEKMGNRISLDICGQTTDFYGCEVSVFTIQHGWVGYSLAKKWGLV